MLSRFQTSINNKEKKHLLLYNALYYSFLIFIFLLFSVRRSLVTKEFYIVTTITVVYLICYSDVVKNIFRNKVFLLSFLIVSYAIVSSALFGQVSFENLKASFRLIIFLLIMVFFFPNMRRLQTLLGVIVSATIVGSVVEVYDYFISGSYLNSMPLGVDSKFLNQIYAGGIYSLVAIISVYQSMICKNYAARTWYAFCSVYMSALIFLTQSRAALLCFIFSILIYFIIGSKRFIKIGFVVLVILIAMAGLFNEYVYDLSTLIERRDSYRLQIWMNSFDILRGNIIFGHGLGSDYILKLDSYKYYHPHNLYLYAIYTGGLVCLVLLFVLLWTAFNSILSNYDKVHGPFMMSILFFIITFNFFDSRMIIEDIGVGWHVFWIPIGLIAAFSSFSNTVSADV